MNLPPADYSGVPEPARPRRWWLWFLLAAVTAVAIARFRTAPPPPPIPVPAGIATLDPQVRLHLARLAEKLAGAPRDAELRADLGLALAVNGLWTEARQCFTQAVFLGDSRPLPAMYGAVALQESGDYPGAVTELREVTRKHPEFAPAWYRLGRALLANGQSAEATNSFAAVTRLAPGDWHGWAGLGEALLRGGQATAALEPLTRARELDPTARSVRHVLGQALQAAGRTTEAELELAAGGTQSVGPMPDPWSQKALDHMMALPDQFERTDALMAAGDFREAAARLGEALRFHPTNALVIASLARALTGGGQPPIAWKLLTNALARTPGDPSILIAAVDTAAALGWTNDAVELAGRALNAAPQSAEARVAQANALLATGRDAEAAVAIRGALDLSPRDANLWVQFGDLHRHNLKQPEEALAAYRHGHHADPIHPAPFIALITLLTELGRPQEAREMLIEFRRLSPDPALLRDLEQRLR